MNNEKQYWRFLYWIGTCILASTVLVTQGQSQSIIRETLVFPLQEQHVHGSSLVELPDGDMLLAWFQGSGERHADDVRIMGSRLRKGATIWSEAFELADTPNLPDCNPVLFVVNGKLFLVWIAVQANRWEQSILRVRTSVDYNGEGAPLWQWQDNILLKPDDTFSEEVARRFREVPDLGRGWAEYAPTYDQLITDASKDQSKRSMGWMTRIKPLILDGGNILLPLYSDGFNLSMLAISEDGGDSWQPSLPIVGRGPIQPTLAQRLDGTIVAYMRDSGDAPGRIQVSESSDGGKTWSTATKTDMPNTASVDMAVLPDGRWVLLCNDVEDGRYSLCLYYSTDEGRTWQGKTAIEYTADKSGKFSYPSLIVGKNGLIFMSYSYHLKDDKKSIKYVVVDPNKLGF